ncbi:hypothetical protein [Cellulosimicrobium sp. NPDC057127]|uniref:hypothetical protein n=1 Tax=Cellulosimicrobium sp. NPDC057127 TaxID=3346026 RepID=UPI00363E7BF2
MTTRSTRTRPTLPAAAASALVDSQVERLGHELTLVERQLTGYSRRTGAYTGHGTLETVEPAVGRYRDELEAERERILTRIGFLSAMRTAVLHPRTAPSAVPSSAQPPTALPLAA